MFDTEGSWSEIVGEMISNSGRSVTVWDSHLHTSLPSYEQGSAVNHDTYRMDNSKICKWFELGCTSSFYCGPCPRWNHSNGVYEQSGPSKWKRTLLQHGAENIWKNVSYRIPKYQENIYTATRVNMSLCLSCVCVRVCVITQLTKSSLAREKTKQKKAGSASPILGLILIEGPNWHVSLVILTCY